MFRYKIRPAKYSDADRIFKICTEVLKSTISKEDFNKAFSDIIEDIHQIIIVALHSGSVVAFIHAKRMNELTRGSYYTEICDVAQTKYFEKHGASMALVFSAEKWSSEMLSTNIRYRLKDDDEAMRNMFRECGFAEKYQGFFEKKVV